MVVVLVVVVTVVVSLVLLQERYIHYSFSFCFVFKYMFYALTSWSVWSKIYLPDYLRYRPALPYLEGGGGRQSCWGVFTRDVAWVMPRQASSQLVFMRWTA